MRQSFGFLVVMLTTSLVGWACGGGSGGGGTHSTYSVIYNGNGATGGTVPVDPNSYAQGQTVTVLGNAGNLVESGHSFAGWNTQANGSGTAYTQGQTFSMGSGNVTCYAQWTASGGVGNVVYNANGATGGSVPIDSTTYSQGQKVTVLGNAGNLVYTGYTFVGWQTKADGSGTAYAPGTTFTMSANVTLYALWSGGSAYAVNQNGGGAGSVSQYTIGPNGALTPMSTPAVATSGANSQQVMVDPSGKYAYVSNVSGESISQFTIDPTTGALTPMTPPAISVGSGATLYYPMFIAVHPSGKWAYVSITQKGYVNQYTIGSDGKLSPMTPPNVRAGAYLTGITVDPFGKYAYAANGRENTVSQYTIDQTTGALSAMTPPTVAADGTAGNENAYFVAVEPKGRFAYVTNYFNGTVSQYTINQTTGALSRIGPVATGGTYAVGSIAFDPLGKYAYVAILAGSPAAVVAQFDINQTSGTLSPMTPVSTVSAGGAGAAYIAVESSGKYVYATSGNTGWGSASVAQYTIDPNTGALTLMNNATVQTGSWPNGIITVGK